MKLILETALLFGMVALCAGCAGQGILRNGTSTKEARELTKRDRQYLAMLQDTIKRKKASAKRYLQDEDEREDRLCKEISGNNQQIMKLHVALKKENDPKAREQMVDELSELEIRNKNAREHLDNLRDHRPGIKREIDEAIKGMEFKRDYLLGKTVAPIRFCKVHANMLVPTYVPIVCVVGPTPGWTEEKYNEMMRLFPESDEPAFQGGVPEWHDEFGGVSLKWTCPECSKGRAAWMRKNKLKPRGIQGDSIGME